MNESPLKLKDLVCFSHHRWNFLYQRPHHLMSRFSKNVRVFFIEEPLFEAHEDRLEISQTPESVILVIPHMRGPSGDEAIIRLQDLISEFFENENIKQYIFWYYTPMALRYSAHLNPELTIYDCIDELSAFKLAAPDLKEFEHELLAKADLVFAGGQSLYESKRKYHERIYLFPNSIDKSHFEQARSIKFDLPDQENIPHPRIGFFGVIDERMDLSLLERVSRMKPGWHFIMIGPVVRIDLNSLPNFHNIHYLGAKTYNELPHYLAGWDVAMIPFAHNEATRFISPSKTPEYLAAGKPVVSTPIIDVIRPYGNKGLVRIAGTPDEFVRVVEQELNMQERDEWMEKVDHFLSQSSWDKTWSQMVDIIGTTLTKHSKTETIETK